MNASIVDLRYKMSEVLAALARRERITIFYHGKVKGVIVPAEERSKSKASKHPFFGMASGEKKAVEQMVEELRGGAIVIFDTDIFIWVQRENKKAADLIDEAEDRYLSVQSYMELLQCARDKGQQRLVKQFISDLGFIVLPLSENIGHRALIYAEEYGLSSGMRAGDAIIAASAVENNMPLASGNGKHFKAVKELCLKLFKP